MPLRQRIFALTISLGLLLLIIELVRRRKLREEYSALWILTGVVVLILALWFELLEWITGLIGAVLPVSTLFFFGLFFLILICLYFSVKMSEINNQVRDLAQAIGILETHIQELQAESESEVAGRPGEAPQFEVSEERKLDSGTE
jgi:hypothetical protein